jgi:hypothetical protein
MHGLVSDFFGTMCGLISGTSNTYCTLGGHVVANMTL